MRTTLTRAWSAPNKGKGRFGIGVIIGMGMSHKLEELPLFPMDTVLFPYASLQLHIFEEKHRDMVRRCLEFDQPFGIVLIRSNAEGGFVDPYMVGTAVRIQQVQTYDDGRMDIHVHGERRFRIRELDETQTYLIGRVEPVVECEPEPDDQTNLLFYRARENFETLIQKLFSKQEFNVQVVFPTDPVALSFTIANLLPMENLEKQRLLETTDTVERVTGLLPILETQLEEAHTPSYYQLTAPDLREWIYPN